MANEKSAVAELEVASYRLPRTVVPSNYQIHLEPDLKTFKFAGEVLIAVDVVKPVKQIQLNALEMDIHKAEIRSDDGTKYEGTVTFDEKDERAIFNFADEIKPGPWRLYVKFTGTLNEKLRGFYRSSYKDAAGNAKVMATTQFEATHARRAFPCWDEPDFKATYTVTLVIDENLTAVSNGALSSEKKLGNGKKELVFNETMKMSTYLVAFIVGELEATEPVMAGKTPIRIYAVPGKGGRLAQFAQGIAVHSLNYFANYFGVPYPGEKLDLIAIPDFAFGAMENLGCVTFRETALLVDAKEASHAEQERVADVVAHEIAHMWFGDLTTMGWWNGIWLNEAFATFAEMLAVDTWKPEWKRWESFGASRAAAMITDGLEATRPIEYPVARPEECEGMFDVLTYEKGASVLRQLEQYITPAVFQKGMNIYLNRHKFANTETSDLWAALAEASGQPVVSLMDSWIYQKGHPVVFVDADASGQKVELRQQRFFYLKDRKSDQSFQVPIMYRAKTAAGDEQDKVLLSEEKTTISLKGKLDWIVVNQGGHGFYRVRYSSDLLARLTKQVFDVLSPVERFNLVNDTWAMVVAGHTPLVDYMKMLEIFRHERDKNVWSVIAGSLIYLDRVRSEGAATGFQKFVCAQVEHAHKELGWAPKAGEDELTGQLRGSLISLMGAVGKNEATIKKALDVYGQYKKDPTKVDPNVVPAVMTVLAATGDSARYEDFYKEYKGAKTPQEEDRYMYSLAAFPDAKLLERTLKLCLSDEVRTQNAPYLMRNVMLNTSGRKLAWQFWKDNWKTITTRYPDNSIVRMCEGVASLACPDLEKDVLAFFKANPVPSGEKTMSQHLERLRVAVLFKEREEKTLKF